MLREFQPILGKDEDRFYGCMIAPKFNLNEITNYFTCNQVSLEKNNYIEFRHDNESRNIFKVNCKNGEGRDDKNRPAN